MLVHALKITNDIISFVDEKWQTKVKNMPRMCARLQKKVDLNEPTSLLGEVNRVCTH